MPGFPKPRFDYVVDVERERERLRAHKAFRGLPDRSDGHLLLATWNIANLGATEQPRDNACFALLAEIVSWFDLVSIVEVRDNVNSGIRRIKELLPDSWRLLFSEVDGNYERMGFLWDSDRVTQGELVGKAVVEPKDLDAAGGSGFRGFSRTPYVGSFHCGSLAVALVSVHSFFGKPRDPLDMARRLAETKALAWWCDRENRRASAYTRDILALGDFNTPSEDDMALAEQMLNELRAKGLYTPRYTAAGEAGDQVLATQIGTAVRSENHYDQLLYFPKNTEADLAAHGVFDFDAAIYADLWQARGRRDFNDYVVWAISDHRPLWAQLVAPPG